MMMDKETIGGNLPFTKENLAAYLSSLYQTEVHVNTVSPLESEKTGKKIKGYGYGRPLYIEFSYGKEHERIVLHTIRPGKFGHERVSDRAASLILDLNSFNLLEKHVRALDAGAILSENGLLSVGKAEEFFLLTVYEEGEPYAQDFKRISQAKSLDEIDQQRVLLLADYLADIHAVKHEHPSLYLRRVRDLFGHGEGIFGIVDSYPPDSNFAPPERLEAIEEKLIEWRWKLKRFEHRLCQVHGDFHPWNILFKENQDFVVLDRSRGIWGEAADDVSALTINYLFFSLQTYGKWEGPFKILYEFFWDRYLDRTNDEEMLALIQPFTIWRALVLADPVWYPNLADDVRRQLFVLIENLLQVNQFDPRQMGQYLKGG
jgi:hypothetical protein